MESLAFSGKFVMFAVRIDRRNDRIEIDNMQQVYLIYFWSFPCPVNADTRGPGDVAQSLVSWPPDLDPGSVTSFIPAISAIHLITVVPAYLLGLA